jgi:selenide,water dikinase
MLPGHLAGHYTYDECHVDLSLLATFAKARLVVAKAENIDLQARSSTQFALESLPA